jgi:tight adherence protein C
MIIPFASLLVFAAVVLVMNGLRSTAEDPFAVRMRAVREGVRTRNPGLERPFVERAVGPAVSGLARLLLTLLPTTWIKMTEQRLIWAGNPMTLAGFVLIWASMTAGFALIAVLVMSSFGSGLITLVISAVVAGAAGAMLPQILLRARIADRHYRTRKSLPDALDLMTTSVEAGLSLDAALSRVAEYQTGPFQTELKMALQEMTLGKSRREALEGICERMNVPEVINFVQTINQAEVTGAPIGQVLRVQAEQVRVKRRQAAEAQAQRAPLLMIIPLVLFIFPSLFVVLLAPAALTIIDLLKNSGPFK